MSGQQIGAILSGAMLARTVASPLISVWVEGLAHRRAAMVRLSMLAAIVYSFYPLANGFWAYFIITMVGGALFSAMYPLMELMTLNRATEEKFSYGLTRGVGSAAFMAGNLIMGVVLSHTHPVAVVIWMIAFAWAAALLAHNLPIDHCVGDNHCYRSRLKYAAKSIWADRTLMGLIVAAGIIQSAHAFNYSFSALLWRGQGISEGIIGLYWSCAIIAEIVFLAASPWMLTRFGARGLMIIGGVGAVVRWLGLSTQPVFWVTIALQALHMLSFTATFIGILHIIRDRCAPGVATVAQTINSALSGGAMLGVMTLVSGHLYDRMGAHGYWVMAGVAAAGLILVVVCQPHSAGVGGETTEPL